MTKRSGVKKSIRIRILRRDGHVCQKCGRRECLNVHHIQAVQDKGSDEDSNLIAICVACHREWELAEMSMDITFEEWLPLPPYSVLLSAFIKRDDFNESVSAEEMYKAISETHKLAQVIRSSILRADMLQEGIDDIDLMSPSASPVRR